VSVQFGIKDLCDLILDFAVYFHRRRRFDSAIWDCTRCVWCEHGDVVDRVDFAHGIRKAEDKGVGTGLSNDFVWTEILFGKLFRGLGSLEEPGLHERVLTDLEFRRRYTAVVGSLLITLLGSLNV
jgi:hypothetical protein